MIRSENYELRKTLAIAQGHISYAREIAKDRALLGATSSLGEIEAKLEGMILAIDQHDNENPRC